jgi:hypothetical protein
MKNNQKRNAIVGFIGAVLFMIGDCLLYVYPGRNMDLDIDPIFSEMPVWRFTVSAFLGFFGMAFMLFGFQSLYSMTKRVCGKFWQLLMVAGAAGVGGTAFAHFNLGSLMPLTYKAVLATGESSDIAMKACESMVPWITPIDIVIIIALYIQFVALGYMILSGKSGLRRWFILVSPIGAIGLGLLWAVIFKGTILEGGWGACESLGEGLMYLTAFAYWKKTESIK